MFFSFFRHHLSAEERGWRIWGGGGVGAWYSEGKEGESFVFSIKEKCRILTTNELPTRGSHKNITEPCGRSSKFYCVASKILQTHHAIGKFWNRKIKPRMQCISLFVFWFLRFIPLFISVFLFTCIYSFIHLFDRSFIRSIILLFIFCSLQLFFYFTYL